MVTRRPVVTTAYRYPHERLILALTLILVFLVIVLTATATFCLTFLAVVAMVALSYAASRSHHRELIARGERVTRQNGPALARIIEESAARLQTGPVEVFVTPSNRLNAYTFGLTSPRVVVLNSALLRVMDVDELRFVLGHELGHVRLGHTWLNSLVGGLAGTPSPLAVAILLTFVFRWWNRACEHSADRAGLLACGQPDKAISALVKLAVGPLGPGQEELARALQYVEAEDDHPLANLGKVLSTHPMAVKRIEELRRYTRTEEYHRLQALVDQNVTQNTPILRRTRESA